MTVAVQPSDIAVADLPTEGVTAEKPTYRGDRCCRHGHCLFRQPRNRPTPGTAEGDRRHRTDNGSIGHNWIGPAAGNDDRYDQPGRAGASRRQRFRPATEDSLAQLRRGNWRPDYA